ncbi:hypothetical protein FDECE_13345 [Fusarium decemcellulare]|nr:hypothetical protein FDECE_13345 [Fusarium decemcellulare]
MDGQAPHDDSTGARALIIITPFFALGLLLFVLRMYTRITPVYKLNISDYLITIAVIAETITYSLFAAAVTNGFGRHNYYITPASSIAILKCLFGVMFTGLWVSTFARLSIAFLLLSFSPARAWKMVLWFIIGFQAVTLVASEIFQLLECRPVRAMWEPIAGAKCMPVQKAWVIGYVFVGASMFSDLMLTILPMFLVWNLSRSVVERFLVSVLMGLSLFATIATALKIVYMKTFDITSPDVFRATMSLFLWPRLSEPLVGWDFPRFTTQSELSTHGTQSERLNIKGAAVDHGQGHGAEHHKKMALDH